MLLFYLQLGEVTPSSLGSPVHFLVSVGRTTTRTGYESGSKAHNNFQPIFPTLQAQVWDGGKKAEVETSSFLAAKSLLVRATRSIHISMKCLKSTTNLVTVKEQSCFQLARLPQAWKLIAWWIRRLIPHLFCNKRELDRMNNLVPGSLGSSVHSEA